MKIMKVILGVIVLTGTITCFGFINWTSSPSIKDKISTCHLPSINNPLFNELVLSNVTERSIADLNFEIGPRFRPITKKELSMVSSIQDFLTLEEFELIDSYKSVSVIQIKNEEESEAQESSERGLFTDGQLRLLHSFEHSDNFLVRAKFLEKNHQTGKVWDNHLSPQLTVVPEVQAEYNLGNTALIEFIKGALSENLVHLRLNNLQAANLYFTISATGGVTKLHMVGSSGDGNIDKMVIELMTNLPGKWTPAKNHIGESVDQELVFSIGNMGC